MLVIKSLFINKVGLIGDRYELLNSSDGNGWKHSGSGERMSHCFFCVSKAMALTLKHHTYNVCVPCTTVLFWKQVLLSEDALIYFERNTDGLHENSSKQQN